MNYSTYKKLQKPISNEKYNVGVFNTNVDIIDSELHKHDLKDAALENKINIHINDKSNPHAVTKAQIGLDKVENKSSSDIRNEISESNIISALGYAPSDFTQTAITNHDTSSVAHTDIRNLISVLTIRLNSLANSDDTTLDQLSEIVDYIKSNRTLIENVTTNKVNVTDIINSLTSTAIDKPLSANQGYVLKGLIGTLENALNNHISNTDIHIESTERIAWNTAKTHADSAHAPVTAEKNTIVSVKKNGTELPIDNSRAVNIEVPTKLSELTNDKGYITSDDVDTSQNHTHTNKSILDNTTESYTADVKTKIDETNVAYGTCSTAAATAAKIVTISGNTKWVLKAGAIISIKFSYTNTAQNPTLNVNNTGAKSIFYNTSVITTGNLSYAGNANRYIQYVYDGTQFVFIGWSIDMNNTYTPMTLGGGYGTCSTAEATIAKTATLSGYALVTGGIVVIKFTYNVPASATLNINSKGAKAIYYRGSAITANRIQAGDIVTFIYNGSQYHVLAVDRNLISSGGSQIVYQSSEPSSNLVSGMVWIG